MDRAEILGKVIALTSEELEVDAEDLGEDSEFKSLGADSFDLLTAFEEEFATTMDDDALQGIETIGDAVDAICNAC